MSVTAEQTFAGDQCDHDFAFTVYFRCATPSVEDSPLITMVLIQTGSADSTKDPRVLNRTGSWKIKVVREGSGWNLSQVEVLP